MRTCRTRGDVGRIEKLIIRSAPTKWIAPNKCQGIFFFALVRPSTLEYHHQQGKCRCLLPLFFYYNTSCTIALFYAIIIIIRIYSIIPIYLQVCKTEGLTELHWVISAECIRENYLDMLPENITCAFKNKASFIKLEIKSECFYYLEARWKIETGQVMFIRWNLSNKSIITHKKFTTCSTQNSKKYIFQEH